MFPSLLSLILFIHVSGAFFYRKELTNSMYSPKPVTVNVKTHFSIISTETVRLVSLFLVIQSS